MMVACKLVCLLLAFCACVSVEVAKTTEVSNMNMPARYDHFDSSETPSRGCNELDDTALLQTKVGNERIFVEQDPEKLKVPVAANKLQDMQAIEKTVRDALKAHDDAKKKADDAKKKDGSTDKSGKGIEKATKSFKALMDFAGAVKKCPPKGCNVEQGIKIAMAGLDLITTFAKLMGGPAAGPVMGALKAVLTLFFPKPGPDVKDPPLNIDQIKDAVKTALGTKDQVDNQKRSWVFADNVLDKLHYLNEHFLGVEVPENMCKTFETGFVQDLKRWLDDTMSACIDYMAKGSFEGADSFRGQLLSKKPFTKKCQSDCPRIQHWLKEHRYADDSSYKWKGSCWDERQEAKEMFEHLKTSLHAYRMALGTGGALWTAVKGVYTTCKIPTDSTAYTHLEHVLTVKLTKVQGDLENISTSIDDKCTFKLDLYENEADTHQVTLSGPPVILDHPWAYVDITCAYEDKAGQCMVNDGHSWGVVGDMKDDEIKFPRREGEMNSPGYTKVRNHLDDIYESKMYSDCIRTGIALGTPCNVGERCTEVDSHYFLGGHFRTDGEHQVNGKYYKLCGRPVACAGDDTCTQLLRDEDAWTVSLI